MHPKCYQSAILLYSGSGSRPGEISHIIGRLKMPRPAGILSLLGLEMPIIFQTMLGCFEDFDWVSSRHLGFARHNVVRITGLR